MLSFFTSLITLIYYLLVALVSGILLYNLIKSKSWDQELLYMVVLLPFLLRLFMLK